MSVRTYTAYDLIIQAAAVAGNRRVIDSSEQGRFTADKVDSSSPCAEPYIIKRVLVDIAHAGIGKTAAIVSFPEKLKSDLFG